jgi:hypothetical protein
MFAIVERILIADMSTNLEEEDDNTAYVSCTHYESTTFVGDEPAYEYFVNTFVLTKEDGRWLICEIISESE